MDLYFRKLLSSYFLPLPITLTIILIGLALAWRFRKTGLIIALAGWVALYGLALSPISDAITASLENDYKPLLHAPSDASYIVVLGGGVRANPNVYPANTQLAASSLSRLIEGIRLYRVMQQQNQAAKLILSGGSIFNSPSVSGIMRNIAIMLGVPQSNLVLEPGSQNTYQEAKYLKKTLGKRPFILVTSATHMRRSMAIFHAAGTHPIPAPTQYFSKGGHDIAKNLIPRAKNLTENDLTIHEYLGLIWAKLNSQI